uniref:adenylate cyclase n=1 Tax=Perinereis aibuhitensis TaxID=126650 RepID=A0A1S6KJN1_PERAI|nr:adenylate cyclase [Perinereis aibuhitensis]
MEPANNRFSMSLAFERKNRWQRILYRYRFMNEELEALYQRYIYGSRLSSVVALLVLFILLTATIGILNFIFVSHITVKNVYCMAQCGISVLLLVYIHTKFMQQTHLLPVTCIIWVLCLSFAIVALPVDFGDPPDTQYTPAAGVWQITLTIFLVYSLMPLKIYVSIITGLLLPVTHSLIVIFFVQQTHWLLWREITANVIIFLAVNVTGIFVHDRCEHAQRRAFMDTRNCIAARLEMEEENEKLERLLLSVFPQHVAMEMKTEILTPHENLFHNVHVQKYDSVSLLFADLVGFTSISAQCTAQELVKILNELFGKFDDLAQDNECLRVRVCGDNYFSVCGLPDAREDHAASCVQLALDMVNLISELREATEVDLNLRVGVHTGSVVCGVIGTKKWHYDVWSDDVITAGHVEACGVPGRVHISQTTLEHLHGAFDVEPAHSQDSDPYMKSRNMDTFFVINNKPRKSSSLLRNKSNSTKAHSLKNIASPVVRLMSALRFSAEIPFTQVYQTLLDGNQIKPGEKIRKSAKKRGTASLQRSGTDRVNSQLSQAIATRTLRKDKRQQVNPFTLRFKKSHHERMYQHREDSSFATSMLCCLVTLVCAATLQAVVLPRTLLLLVLFLVTFSWVATLLMMVLGNKMRCVRCSIQRSSSLRLCIMLITILLIHAMAQVNVFCCKGGKLFTSKAIELGSNPVISFHHDEHLVCEMPEYIFLAGVLGYLVIIVFLKLAALIKLLLMLLMMAGYLVVMEYSHAGLFTKFDELSVPDIPTHIKGIVAMISFLLTLYMHGRHQEWTYRLDFLWKNQATEEKIEIAEMQNNNRHVLCSLLPAHVAAHFIDMHHRTHMDLYSQAYFRVGILFASIANFPGFFSEMSHEGKSVDCLRLLHRLIAGFDELLMEDRFRYIDKIKTSGTTYMAVVGLRPDKIIQDTEESITNHLSTLLEFYFALRSKVQNFNETHGFSFSLRAGAHMGPAVAGVIGAKQPQYDIFGSTVNIANTMENTCRPDYLQVTEEIYRPMYQRYDFQSRGLMMLKHRGQTNTFYVVGRKAAGPSQVSMPNMSTIQWREAGVQLRNSNKRSSFTSS